MRGFRHLVVAIALASMLTGCVTIPISASPKRAEDTPKAPTKAELTLPPAGLYKLPGGRLQALGFLRSESSVWVLVSRDGGAFVALASKGPSKVLDGADRLYGNFVVVEGTRLKARAGYPIPVIDPDVMRRVEPPSVKDGIVSVDGIPPRWARVEKPSVQKLSGGRVRIVGTLEYGTAAGKPNVWFVRPILPYVTMPTLPSAILAPGSKTPKSVTAQPYAAVVGKVVGYRKHGKTRIPIVKVTSLTVLTKLKPAPYESMR